MWGMMMVQLKHPCLTHIGTTNDDVLDGDDVENDDGDDDDDEDGVNDVDNDDALLDTDWIC